MLVVCLRLLLLELLLAWRHYNARVVNAHCAGLCMKTVLDTHRVLRTTVDA